MSAREFARQLLADAGVPAHRHEWMLNSAPDLLTVLDYYGPVKNLMRGGGGTVSDEAIMIREAHAAYKRAVGTLMEEAALEHLRNVVEMVKRDQARRKTAEES